MKVVRLREVRVRTGVGTVGDPIVGSRLLGGSFGIFGWITGHLRCGFGAVRNINLRVVDSMIT